MAHQLKNKQNVTGPNSTFPFGDIKDNPGNNTGTPYNRAVYGDFHQFFAKTLSDSGITPNDLDENAVNGFQYFDALKIVSRPITTIQLVTSTPYDPTSYYASDPASAYKTAFKIIPLAGDITFNLPPASSLLDGAPVTIIHQGSFGYKVIIIPNGTDAIEGGGSYELASPGDCLQIINDHANEDWIITVTNINRGAIFTGEIVHAGATTNLSPTEAGNLIIYSGSGAGTFNLWQLSPYDRCKRITIFNNSGGELTLNAFLGDSFSDITTVQKVEIWDCIELEASDVNSPFSPVWNIISINRRDWSKPVVTATLGAGWTGTAKYYCDAAGWIHFSGTLTYTVSTPSYVSPFSLNPGYRPVSAKKIPTLEDNSYQGVMVPARIDIATSGVVSLIDSANSNPNTLTIYLDGISFYKNW